MIELAGGTGGVVAITVTSAFRRRDASEVSRCVRDGVDAGERRFVLDISGAETVNEGLLVLTLLGLRSELQRRSGRLVVAARSGLARRLGTRLRLDDLIDAAPSRDEAIGKLGGAP
jgi:hypothetical protein